MTVETSTLDVSNNVGCGCAACMRTDSNPSYLGEGEGSAANPPSSKGPDNLLSGSVWSNDGNGITLTYNFWNSLPTYYDSGDDETTGFKALTCPPESRSIF